MLQKHLDTFKDTIWNTHRIQKQTEAFLPDGVPNHVFEFPEKYDPVDCGQFSLFNVFFLIIYHSIGLFQQKLITHPQRKILPSKEQGRGIV